MENEKHRVALATAIQGLRRHQNRLSRVGLPWLLDWAAELEQEERSLQALHLHDFGIVLPVNGHQDDNHPDHQELEEDLKENGIRGKSVTAERRAGASSVVEHATM